jgi:cytochrome c oxidase assembly protein Cox11
MRRKQADRALQQAGVLLLQPVHAGTRREEAVAGGSFVIDPRLPKDVTTITLSYTFFEVGGKTPAAPSRPPPPHRAGRA